MPYILPSAIPWEEIAHTRNENPTPVPYTAACFARWDNLHCASYLLAKVVLIGKYVQLKSGSPTGTFGKLSYSVAGPWNNLITKFHGHHRSIGPMHVCEVPQLLLGIQILILKKSQMGN